LIEGSICKCGFKTIAQRDACPRCGKRMIPKEFLDEGIVLSFTRLQIPPEGFLAPLDLVMVELDEGPKLVCWTDSELKVDQKVRIYTEGEIMRCKPS